MASFFDPQDIARSSRRSYRHNTGQITIEHPLILFIPILLGGLILLGGGSLILAQGLVLIAVGMGLLFKAPKMGFGTIGDKWALAFFLSPLLGLLPAALSTHGAWREAAFAYDIALPYTVAVHFKVMIEQIFWTWGAFGALYLFSNLNFSHVERRLVLLEWVFILVLLGIGVLVGNSTKATYFYGASSRVFSYFPSKNETANILFVGGVLAFGLALDGSFKKRYWQSFFCSLALIILFAATVQTHSRAGSLLLLVGCILIIIVQIKEWSRSLLLRIGIPASIVLISLFLLMGPTFFRFLNIIESGDFRLSIYIDSIHLIKDHWLAGVGLGNFEDIINFYRKLALSAQKTLHPESDVLWWISEVGIVGMVAAAGFMYQLIRNLLPLNHAGRISSRYIPAVALVVFFFHSLVDVPVHFYGTLMPALFIYGLARSEPTQLNWLSPLFFKTLGVVLGCLGVVWTLAGSLEKPWHSRIEKDQDRASIESALSKNDPIKLDLALTKAINDDNFDWWLYYTRGSFDLWYKQDTAAAKKDFDRALFIEPISSVVPYYVGIAWLPYSPKLAYDAWHAALQRQSENMSWLYEEMIRSAVSYKDFQPYLDRLSEDSSAFRGYYLTRVDSKKLLELLPKDLLKNSKLESLDQNARQTIFETWAQLDPEVFLSYARDNNLWIIRLWYAKACAYAGLKDWKTACELAHQNAPIPPLPKPPENQSITEAERAFSRNSKDTWIGQNLLNLQLRDRDFDGAEETLRMLEMIKPTPPYVFYWKAEIAAYKEHYEDGWKYWSLYLKALKENAG